MNPAKICARLCIVLPFVFCLGVSTNAQTPLGSKGQILNHCDHTCNRELDKKNKEGNYLFKETTAKNTCDNAALKEGIKDAEGKSEKIELVCKCRFIAKYTPDTAKEKPAKAVIYNFDGHTAGDEVDLGIETLTKNKVTELEEHGWVITVGCIGTSGNLAIYKNNPKKKKETP